MVRKGLFLAFLSVLVISLAGCATGRKQGEMEVQGLKNQISVLEAQIQSKDEEINSLRGELCKMQAENEAPMNFAGKGKMGSEPKSRPNVKQIQTALRNAGYNPGEIDGKMGAQTTEAIKAFQSASNLPADGKVGKNTWAVLRSYLHKKIK
ncbi:MAG: peptidoglycan-binding domain-containing protein [Candidatus Omnitrophica bacterium]|nr:peptidoglycan-binding domain-containing protein [Candidatus Omnitrophota bacterium]